MVDLLQAIRFADPALLQGYNQEHSVEDLRAYGERRRVIQISDHTAAVKVKCQFKS
jgi:hypothetical protein